ncbi:MAG: TonB-dependent receptor domain-containing protein, partial [Candidatus Acidiferrales bacterium]
FNLGPNDRLHGYLALQQDVRQEPTLQGNSLPGWGDTRSSRRQIMTINEDHVFGPNLTNEVRLGYNRLHILFAPNQPLNPANFGIVNGITGSIGLPQIVIGAVGTAGALDIGGPSGFPQGRGDTTVVLSDTLHWLRGRHSFAFGGEVRRFYNNNIAQNIGSYTFASLQNFLNDQSNRFNVTIGSGNDKILEPAWGIFVQDNFKMTRNFTLELGLRYDYNSTPTEANGQFSVFVPGTVSLVQVGTNGVGQVFHTNNKNIQPRLGFAWNPFHNDKTVVRAAYAILTDQPVTNAVSPFSSNPPFALPVTTTSATNSITFLNTGSATAGSIAPATISSTFDNPYVQSWNLNVQQEITPSFALMVGYFGSKGTHLRILLNENQKGNLAAVPFGALSASSPILPGKALSNINEVDSSSNSNYNALWVTLTKHVTHGLQFNASYTYSHSLDENSLTSIGSPAVQDSTNIRNDYGPSDFDVRHRFVLSGIYDLPFKGNRLYEGWELGIITQAQSGNPLNIITSNTAFTGNQTVRPDLTGPIVTTGNPAQWFANPAVFVATNPVHFGNLGRNAVLGPDFVNTDFSLIKNTKLTETTNLQFRAEMFDIFNHPNFGNPGRVVGSSTFGQITSTRVPTGDFGSSRQIQLALKFLF